MINLSLRKYRPGVNNGCAVIALFSILLWTTLGGDTRVAAADGEIQKTAPANVDQDIPTIIPATCGDIETRAKELSVAIPGGDRQTVVKILSTCTREQRQQIADAYSRMYERDLVERMEYQYHNIFYPNFKRLTTSLTVPLPRLLVDCISNAFYSNDINLLNDVLTPLINDSTTAAMKEFFEKKYGGPIAGEKAASIITGTSQFHRNIISAAYNGLRSSDNTPHVAEACSDARKIIEDEKYGRLLTADSDFQVILTTRSYFHLKLVGECFQSLTKRSLLHALTALQADDGEYSMQFDADRDANVDACITILNYAEGKAAFFAEKLRQAVAGSGTDNEALIFFISWRADIDLGNIKKAYVELKNNVYKTTLYADVEDDTSGEYRDLLLAIIGK